MKKIFYEMMKKCGKETGNSYLRNMESPSEFLALLKNQKARQLFG